MSKTKGNVMPKRATKREPARFPELLGAANALNDLYGWLVAFGETTARAAELLRLAGLRESAKDMAWRSRRAGEAVDSFRASFNADPERGDLVHYSGAAPTIADLAYRENLTNGEVSEHAEMWRKHKAFMKARSKAFRKSRKRDVE